MALLTAQKKMAAKLVSIVSSKLVAPELFRAKLQSD